MKTTSDITMKDVELCYSGMKKDVFTYVILGFVSTFFLLIPYIIHKVISKNNLYEIKFYNYEAYIKSLESLGDSSVIAKYLYISFLCLSICYIIQTSYSKNSEVKNASLIACGLTYLEVAFYKLSNLFLMLAFNIFSFITGMLLAITVLSPIINLLQIEDKQIDLSYKLFFNLLSSALVAYVACFSFRFIPRFERLDKVLRYASYVYIFIFCVYPFF